MMPVHMPVSDMACASREYPAMLVLLGQVERETSDIHTLQQEINLLQKQVQAAKERLAPGCNHVNHVGRVQHPNHVNHVGRVNRVNPQTQPGTIECRYGLHCLNEACPYMHPVNSLLYRSLLAREGAKREYLQNKKAQKRASGRS